MKTMKVVFEKMKLTLCLLKERYLCKLRFEK